MHFKFLLVLLVLPFTLTAKNLSDSTIKNNSDSLLKVLQHKLDSLSDVVKSISITNSQNAGSSYIKSYKNAQTAIELLNILDITVYSMLADRNDAIKYTIINQINNPSDNQLGFSFTDKLTDYSVQLINSTNIYEQQKGRLKKTVSNLIEALKKSFPPVNIATTIISTLASYNTPFIEKINSRVRRGDSLLIKIQAPITENMLKSFSDSIMPFLNFYRDLNNISLQFENDLKNHEASYSEYYPSILDLKKQYFKVLNMPPDVDLSNYKESLENIYEQSNSNKELQFYKRINLKLQVQNLNELSLQVLSLAKDFKQFYKDYYKILIKNFKDNIVILNKAKSLSGANPVQINELIDELQSLRTGNNEKAPGFELKFKKNLESIFSRILQIYPS